MIANKRSELDVIADILRIKGSKTAIMYGANLSYTQTQKYLTRLSDAGFIRQGPSGKKGRNVYSPTERGEKLLKLIEVVEDVLDESIKRKGNSSSAEAAKRNGSPSPFVAPSPIHGVVSARTNGGRQSTEVLG